MLKIGLTDQVINAKLRSINVHFFTIFVCCHWILKYTTPTFIWRARVYYRNKHNKYWVPLFKTLLFIPIWQKIVSFILTDWISFIYFWRWAFFLITPPLPFYILNIVFFSSSLVIVRLPKYKYSHCKKVLFFDQILPYSKIMIFTAMKLKKDIISI